jgi:hypothetical protein
MMFPVENKMSGASNWSITVAENELILMKLLWIRKIIDSEPRVLLHGNFDSSTINPGSDTLTKWSYIWGQAIESVYLFHTKRMLMMHERIVAPGLLDLQNELSANQKDFSAWLNEQTPVAGEEPSLTNNLEKAWQQGLRLIISLPWEEEVAQKYNSETLILSNSIRTNSSKYQETLNTFSQSI